MSSGIWTSSMAPRSVPTSGSPPAPTVRRTAVRLPSSAGRSTGWMLNTLASIARGESRLHSMRIRSLKSPALTSSCIEP